MLHALPTPLLLLVGVLAVGLALRIARALTLLVLTVLVGLAALAGGLGLLADYLHL
jgi:hypothetical protein